MQPKENKTDRRVLYTKMFLRESLLALMAEKSVAKITTSELCRHAGINRNTFYTHYDSPENLLQSIEDELFHQVARSIEVSLKSGNIPAFLSEICQAIYENRDLCTVLFSEFGNKVFLKRIIHLAREKTLAQWKAAGLRDTGQIEMLYRFSASGSIAIIETWILENIQKSPAEIARFIEKANAAVLQGFIKI